MNVAFLFSLFGHLPSADEYGSAHKATSDTAHYLVHLSKEGLTFQVSQTLLITLTEWDQEKNG